MNRIFAAISTLSMMILQFADYGATAAERLYRADIISGKGNSLFELRGTATRAEVTKIVMSLEQSDNQTNLRDIS